MRSTKRSYRWSVHQLRLMGTISCSSTQLSSSLPWCQDTVQAQLFEVLRTEGGRGSPSPWDPNDFT